MYIIFQLSSDIKLDPRPEYHRVTMTWSSGEHLPIASSTGNQLSSRLLSFMSAHALLKLPNATETKKTMSAGEQVEAYLLNLP